MCRSNPCGMLCSIFLATILSSGSVTVHAQQVAEHSLAVTEIEDWASRRLDRADSESLQAALTEALAALKGSPADTERFHRLLVAVDPRLEPLLGPPLKENALPPNGPPPWLLTDQVPASIRSHVALHVAGQLHAARYYEETLEWLTWVVAQETLSPHLLHYYRATASQRLVRLAEARESAQLLIDEPGGAQRRHLAVAKLILHDTEQQAEPESLDHVARQMQDIRRRLQLGRSAEPEQDLQQTVLDALDKMIDDAEKQQQQQQQMAGSATPAAPSQAMQESRPAEMKGAGEVDRREVAAGGDWGAMPPVERDRVLQQIGRDFPAHYRDLIQAYFESLAKQRGPNPRQPGSSSQP